MRILDNNSVSAGRNIEFITIFTGPMLHSWTIIRLIIPRWISVYCVSAQCAIHQQKYLAILDRHKIRCVIRTYVLGNWHMQQNIAQYPRIGPARIQDSMATSFDVAYYSFAKYFLLQFKTLYRVWPNETFSKIDAWTANPHHK